MSSESGKHYPHVLPLSTYFSVAGALLALTAITVWMSNFHFGEWNLIVAMAVAVTKAILVALIFMHLLYDNKMYLTVFLSSLIFLSVFITFTLYDTMRRGDIYDEVSQPIQKRAALYETLKKDSTHTKSSEVHH